MLSKKTRKDMLGNYLASYNKPGLDRPGIGDLSGIAIAMFAISAIGAILGLILH